MNRHPQLGFTAIELIITLAIAAILIGMAVPSFVSVVDDAKLGKLVEPTNRALMLARSEAARSRSDVTVCPRATDNDLRDRLGQRTARVRRRRRSTPPMTRRCATTTIRS